MDLQHVVATVELKSRFTIESCGKILRFPICCREVGGSIVVIPASVAPVTYGIIVGRRAWVFPGSSILIHGACIVGIEPQHEIRVLGGVKGSAADRDGAGSNV